MNTERIIDLLISIGKFAASVFLVLTLLTLLLQ
jgi:hypothetical protein